MLNLSNKIFEIKPTFEDMLKEKQVKRLIKNNIWAKKYQNWNENFIYSMYMRN